MSGFAARVVLDSINTSGNRLTTFELTFPRIILAELNTHRMLSRSSASSRAIPLAKQIAKVRETPFLPVVWGKNQKGMQAAEQLSDTERGAAERIWLDARDAVVNYALALGTESGLNVHKQIVNRLLEPFMYHTVIVSATELENFFNLRTHKDAQPEFQHIAKMAKAVYCTSTPVLRQPGEWHLPFVDGVDLPELRVSYMDVEIARISSARCGRVSYLTHDGKRDPTEDLALADRLQKPGHMAPFEMAACALDKPKSSGNFVGWKQFRKMLPGEAVFRCG